MHVTWLACWQAKPYGWSHDKALACGFNSTALILPGLHAGRAICTGGQLHMNHLNLSRKCIWFVLSHLFLRTSLFLASALKLWITRLYLDLPPALQTHMHVRAPFVIARAGTSHARYSKDNYVIFLINRVCTRTCVCAHAFTLGLRLKPSSQASAIVLLSKAPLGPVTCSHSGSFCIGPLVKQGVRIPCILIFHFNISY